MKFKASSTALLESLLLSNKTISDDLFMVINRFAYNEKERYNLYSQLEYLPKNLKREYVKQKIFEINYQLIEFEAKVNINRLTPEIYYDDDLREFSSFILKFVGKDDFEFYMNYKFTKDRLKTYKMRLKMDLPIEGGIRSDLPEFDNLIKYIGKVLYFNDLLERYEFDDFFDLKTEQDNSINKKHNRFITNLTDTQRGKLYDLLVEGGYISPETDKEGFIWVFGGAKGGFVSFQINWQKTNTLAVYFIDELCFKTNPDLWAIGNRVFGIRGMAQTKQNYFDVNSLGKPRGYKDIDRILEEAKK